MIMTLWRCEAEHNSIILEFKDYDEQQALLNYAIFSNPS